MYRLEDAKRPISCAMTSVSESRPPLRAHGARNGVPRGHVTEIQRSRMLAATVEAVAECGYARVTVAQVIARARVSRKTFYDVFSDREDCFLAAFEDGVARAHAHVRDAYCAQSSWREGMRAGLLRLLALMDDERALARLCVVDSLGAGERVLARRAALMGQLAEIVDGGRLVTPSAHEPARLTGEAVVGAVFAVLHARLAENRDEPLVELLGQLMSMIVLPYLGARAAARELSAPQVADAVAVVAATPHTDPLAGLNMRLTYRTLRVLAVIADHPGASNREIAERSGISDQGQVSKLLGRLARLELAENDGGGQERGASNAWRLTARGERLERATRAR